MAITSIGIRDGSDWSSDIDGTGITLSNSFTDSFFYAAVFGSTRPMSGMASKAYTTTAGQSTTWSFDGLGSATETYGVIAVFKELSGGETVVLAGQASTTQSGTITVITGALTALDGQQIAATQGGITVDTGAAGWSIANVDLDDSIYDGQTGVIVAISGTVSATGKSIWLNQGTDWVEQTVTAEDATSATITINYGGVLSAGAATLYVRDPL